MIAPMRFSPPPGDDAGAARSRHRSAEAATAAARTIRVGRRGRIAAAVAGPVLGVALVAWLLAGGLAPDSATRAGALGAAFDDDPLGPAAVTASVRAVTPTPSSATPSTPGPSTPGPSTPGPSAPGPSSAASSGPVWGSGSVAGAWTPAAGSAGAAPGSTTASASAAAGPVQVDCKGRTDVVAAADDTRTRVWCWTGTGHADVSAARLTRVLWMCSGPHEVVWYVRANQAGGTAPDPGSPVTKHRSARNACQTGKEPFTLVGFDIS